MSWAPILLSLEVALCATALAGLFGISLAALLARGSLSSSARPTPRFDRAKEWVDVLITAPMVLPPTVLGYYLLTLLGRNSMIGRAFEAITGGSIAFSRTGAVLAATVAALPFVLKSARVAFEQLDPRLLAAAETLGARPLRVFLRIQLPLARAGIAAGLALGFARSLGEFGITLMLAGNLPGSTQTGALAIYDAVQASRDADATRMSLLMTSIAVALLYLVNRLTKQRAHGF